VHSPVKAQSATTILSAVCNQYNISLFKLLEPTRKRPIVRYRQIAMYLLRQDCQRAGRHISLPEIARELKLLNHTSILYGIQKIEKDMDMYISEIEAIRARYQAQIEQ